MKQYNQSMDWERFFEKASSDVDGYQKALEKWNTSPKNTVGLFLEIVERRGRGLEASGLLYDYPDQYTEAVNRFSESLTAAEKLFRETKGDMTPIVEMVNSNFSMLESLLMGVDYAYDQVFAYDDEEWQEELYERGLDYLETYMRHQYLYQQCDDLGISSEAKQAFVNRFDALERKFREMFFLFSPMSGVLDALRSDAYRAEKYWWLSQEPPEVDPYIEDLTRSALRSMVPSPPCPEQEELAAYAYDDIDEESKVRIKSHILTCSDCFREVIDLTAIYQASKIEEKTELSDRDKEILRRLSQKFGIEQAKPETDTAKHDHREFLEYFSGEASHIFENIRPLDIMFDRVIKEPYPIMQFERATAGREGTTEITRFTKEVKRIEISITADDTGIYRFLPEPNTVEIPNEKEKEAYEDLYTILESGNRHWHTVYVMTEDKHLQKKVQPFDSTEPYDIYSEEKGAHVCVIIGISDSEKPLVDMVQVFEQIAKGAEITPESVRQMKFLDSVIVLFFILK